MNQVNRTMMPIAIRDASEGDVPFIFNSWLESFRSGPVPKFVDNKIYYAEQHKLIERLLRRCTVKMAVDPADPAQIYGYLVCEQTEGIPTYHYAYTKQTYRGMGVCRQLFKEVGHDSAVAAISTHTTVKGAPVSRRYNLIYHPYILINYNAKAAE
jgi:hypothetical protein